MFWICSTQDFRRFRSEIKKIFGIRLCNEKKDTKKSTRSVDSREEGNFVLRAFPIYVLGAWVSMWGVGMIAPRFGEGDKDI